MLEYPSHNVLEFLSQENPQLVIQLFILHFLRELLLRHSRVVLLNQLSPPVHHKDSFEEVVGCLCDPGSIGADEGIRA